MSDSLLDTILNGGAVPGQDPGPAIPQYEGTCRRAYHQVIAAVVEVLLKEETLSAKDLADWVNGPGMDWRKAIPLDRHILPPVLPGASD